MAFYEIVEQYEFCYEAQYPEPPKHAIEACITNVTAAAKKEPENTDVEFKKQHVDLKRQSKNTSWVHCNN